MTRRGDIILLLTLMQEKDLSGTIVSEVMSTLKADPDLARFTAALSAFGRYLDLVIQIFLLFLFCFSSLCAVH